MGIYKRKQKSKKARKHVFDQEIDKEKKKEKKENTLSTKKVIKKNRRNDYGQEKKERKHALDQESDQEKKFFFLDRFPGRECVFFLFSYFLVFFYK